MAFPLFGKKPAPAPLAAKAPARPAGKGAEPKPATEELGSLDFTHTQDPNSMTSRPRIEVKETIHEIPQAIEQAAMLYSIDQAAAASGALEAAIRSNDLGRYAARAWGMLFELYQIEGRRQDFDRLAVEYAAKFESSPPTWVAGDEPAAAPKPVNKSSVSLSGALNAKAQETLKQVFKIAERSPAVRIEVGKVTEVDEHGCGLLNAVLKQMKKARKECVLGGADKLAALVAKSTVPGEPRHEQAWMLLLDLYQQLGNQEAFEEAAVNYAVTFEVSPPSFEVPKNRPAAKLEPEAEAELESEDAGCVLEGVITSATDGAFATIRSHAEDTAEVIVDVSRLLRMDFVAATNLMNLINALIAAKKKVRLIKASHLLTALWEVIGLDRVARVETRKA
ncbi:MAG: STAS domain-containing protein [Rhodocyclales bacterium]|nr:STAS domain-containing protein [Rhodocyclales bacterium]